MRKRPGLEKGRAPTSSTFLLKIEASRQGHVWPTMRGLMSGCGYKALKLSEIQQMYGNVPPQMHFPATKASSRLKSLIDNMKRGRTHIGPRHFPPKVGRKGPQELGKAWNRAEQPQEGSERRPGGSSGLRGASSFPIDLTFIVESS